MPVGNPEQVNKRAYWLPSDLLVVRPVAAAPVAAAAAGPAAGGAGVLQARETHSAAGPLCVCGD